MPSELTFDATENFRKRLLVRNLQPYDEPGFKTSGRAGESEISINDLAVIDGERLEESKIIDEAKKRAFISNQYGPEGGYKDFINITDVQKAIEKRELYYTFLPSVYNSFNLLTSQDPTGTNGSLSQDSALAQIAGQQLKTEFEYRIAEETYQQTLGRINVIDALSDPFDALAIVTGNEQVIESDWKISVPDNIVGKGLDFISRVSGIYSPYSWIPGDYFNKVQKQSSIDQAANDVNGGFNSRGTLLPQSNKRSSELMISNSGRGQTKRLFRSLSLNVFAPDYTDNNRAFGLKAPAGNYYIGSKEQDPSNATFPENLLPIDQRGNKVRVPVRGYNLGDDYENGGNSVTRIQFGLNGSKYLRQGRVESFSNSNYDTPRLQGGFTWVNLDYDGTQGKRAKSGGDNGSTSPQFEGTIASSFDATTSLQNKFREGSILDDTQKLVDAAFNLPGDARLQHVGNAINQVSKVFNDGTRELTKGSRVYQYTDSSTGVIEGIEYCRVFTKDIPYFSNSELQKEEGMTNENRRFQYSVLDKTYNLNIAPFKDDDSTNIQEGKVKKYMFSIENLAWRTSSKKGYTYSDLPVCERGPNGGRIMWFPPYDMKVSETNSTNWTANEFLGRPEPIYTYNNTQRQGNLSWKILVDHPSILNAIVDKELSGENSQRVNDIVDSFFAGCRKYDVYEMARRFEQFSPDDIYDIVTQIENVTDYEVWRKEIPQEPDIVSLEQPIEEYTPSVSTEDYAFEFFFDNDSPGPRSASSTTTTEDYASTISSYIASRGTYITSADESQKGPVDNFFKQLLVDDDGNNIIQDKTQKLVTKIAEGIEKGAKFGIDLKGGASAPNSSSYNLSLSKRRLDAVKKYILSFPELSKHEDKISFNDNATGSDTTAPMAGGALGSEDCSSPLTGANETYSVTAMACRSVIITNINEIEPEPQEPSQDEIDEQFLTIERPNIVQTGTTEIQRPVEVEKLAVKNDLAKSIVRKFLTECDYFRMMKEESPRVYQGIKEKIKYFQPVFHSITPEGLNSRLTFLQQCIRPGDTIPVIGEDGKPREGDVKNTAFGAPPICVLRIGDFYHTKIAIQQISINFEPLTFDLNPEGIGIQPMLADINMSFYFIGGQGLKEPVSRLQNALSFNYYANTEVYDERADATELRPELDREMLDKIANLNDFSVNKDGIVEPSEEIGDTVGEITDRSVSTDLSQNDIIEKGDINYKTFMKDYVLKSQAYTQNVISSLDTINRLQSKIGLYYFTQDRLFTDGKVTGFLDGNNVNSTQLFGKPIKIQNKEADLKTKLLEDVDNDVNPFLKSPFTSIDRRNFKNSDIRKFKKNLKSYINTQVSVFQSIFNGEMTDLLKVQTEYVRANDISNLITTNTDGYKNKKGRIFILSLTGSTDVDPSSSAANTNLEMIDDIKTVGDDLQTFYDTLFGELGQLPPKENLYEGFLEGDYNTEPQTRFCTIAYLPILNNPENVKNTILGEELSQKEDWVKYVNEIIYGFDTLTIPNTGQSGLGGDGIAPITINGQSGLNDVYKELKRTSDLGINQLKNGFAQKFTLYTPFNLEKERKFTYERKPQESADSDKVGYFNKTFTSGINSGPDTVFNEKYTFE